MNTTTIISGDQRPKPRTVVMVFMMLCVMFSSCKKEKNCLTCTFGFVNGVQPEPIEWCGDPAAQFTDEQGNPLQSSCK